MVFMIVSRSQSGHTLVIVASLIIILPPANSRSTKSGRLSCYEVIFRTLQRVAGNDQGQISNPEI